MKTNNGIVPLLRTIPNAENEFSSWISRVNRLKRVVETEWNILESVATSTVLYDPPEISLSPIAQEKFSGSLATDCFSQCRRRLGVCKGPDSYSSQSYC